MARQSKEKNLAAEGFKKQLRWEALRLNPHYRKAHDALNQWIHSSPKRPYSQKYKGWRALAAPGCYGLKFAILPFKKRLLKQAIKQRLCSPFSEDQKIWEDYEDLLSPGQVQLALPSFLRFPKDFFEALDLKPKSNGETFLKAYRLQTCMHEPFSLSFNVFDSREAVKHKVDEVFKLIEGLRELLTVKSEHKKNILLQDMFDIYEEHKYKKKSFKCIARNNKFDADTYNAAYNRIKKRFKTAQEIIEREGKMQYAF